MRLRILSRKEIIAFVKEHYEAIEEMKIDEMEKFLEKHEISIFSLSLILNEFCRQKIEKNID